MEKFNIAVTQKKPVQFLWPHSTKMPRFKFLSHLNELPNLEIIQRNLKKKQ